MPNSFLVTLGISISIRAVKVDMQLSFFFILEERQLKRPVAVRLYEIDEAFPKKRIQAWICLRGFFPSTMYRTVKHKTHTSTFIKHCDICIHTQSQRFSKLCIAKKTKQNTSMKKPWTPLGLYMFFFAFCYLAGAIVYAGC